MKRNYPKNRKPNEKSITQQLLKIYTPDELQEIWRENNGMYKTSRYLFEKHKISVTPNLIRYLSDKYNWTRIVTDKSLAIYRAILRGTQSREDYKHIIFQ
jgi:hypothetical protein